MNGLSQVDISYIETFVPELYRNFCASDRATPFKNAPHLSKSRHTFQNRATPFKIAPHLSKSHRYAFLVQCDRIV